MTRSSYLSLVSADIQHLQNQHNKMPHKQVIQAPPEAHTLAMEKFCQHPMLSKCSRQDLCHMLAASELVEYKKDVPVFILGKKCQDLLFLFHGSLLSYQNESDQKLITEGFVGEEVVCKLSKAVSSIYANETALLLKIPASAIPENLSAVPDGRCVSIMQSLLASPVNIHHNQEVKNNFKSNPYLTFIAWISAILLPLSILQLGETSHYLSDESGQRWQQLGLLAAMSCGYSLWVFRLCRPYIAGLLMIFFILALGIVPIPMILSGFSSNAFFMALSLFGFSAVIVRSGLITRLSLFIVNTCPKNLTARRILVSVCIFIFSHLFPSSKVRIKLWGNLITPLFPEKEINRQKSELLAYFMFLNLTLFSAFFLTGNATNLVLFGIMPEQTKLGLSSLSWLNYSAAAAAITLLAMVVLTMLTSRQFISSQTEQQNTKRLIEVQKKVLGPLSGLERVVCLTVVIYTLALFSTGIHQMDHRLVALLVLSVFLMSGWLERTQIKHVIDWHFLILLGSTIGIMNAASSVGLPNILTSVLLDLGIIRPNSFTLFIVWVSIFSAVVGAWIPRGNLFLGCIFIPIAIVNGYSPWLVAFVLLMTSHCELHPTDSPLFLTICHFFHVNANNHVFVRWQRAHIIFRLFITLISIYIWEFQRII